MTAPNPTKELKKTKRKKEEKKGKGNKHQTNYHQKKLPTSYHFHPTQNLKKNFFYLKQR
jgi:hypothetical protein